MISGAIYSGIYADNPFPYFVSIEALDKTSSFLLLDWLESDAPWKLVETEFYEQFEFSFYDARLPDHLRRLVGVDFLQNSKVLVESKFGVRLADRVDFTAHKLIAGQTIRLHNDYIEGEETHRVIFQLNRGWEDSNGGMLIFFNSNDPADIHRALRPQHNSCVAFEISPASHHAVSTIYGGERYTLVMSFFQEK